MRLLEKCALNRDGSMEGRDSQQQEEVCPLCKELGRNGILLLRQINAHEAIYVCNNPEVRGYNVACAVIQRVN